MCFDIPSKETLRYSVYMKKRTFILVELLLAIAILSICALPILGYPYFSYRKQKELLLSIELERQAEILFYKLQRDLPCTWTSLGFDHNEKTSLNPIHLDIDGLGPITIYPHIHLYIHPNSKNTKLKQGIAKVWCEFCLEKSKNKCSHTWKKHSPYTFNFLAQKGGGI